MVRTVDGIRCSMENPGKPVFTALAAKGQKNIGSEKPPLPFYSPFSTKNYGNARHATTFENHEVPRKHANFGS